MKEIPLTQNKVALVSDCDFANINQWRWFALKSRRTFYAARSIRKANGSQTLLLMHQLLMPGCKRIDHKDHNGLNNQRFNLRPATRSENGANRVKPVGHYTSKFKGVSLQQGHWRADIEFCKKQKYLGWFDSEREAALAYDAAALKHFGEFALTNKQLGLLR